LAGMHIGHRDSPRAKNVPKQANGSRECAGFPGWAKKPSYDIFSATFRIRSIDSAADSVSSTRSSKSFAYFAT
jgi:hypothetical protein